MSEPKFTKGPWWYALYDSRQDGYAKVDDPSLADHLMDCDGDHVITTRSGLLHVERRYAHLIAAAPDLYEALEEVVERMSLPHMIDAPCIVKAKAALAKARGEGPDGEDA